MEITKTKHYTKITGLDDNGEFCIYIQSDCSQLRIEAAGNDSYIDIDYNELRVIRNTITKVLEEYEKLQS